MFDGALITWLGVGAAILQLIGYLVYLRNGDIAPNPLTWLMFAYGTLLMTLLEWGSGATVQELLLPIVCSAMAICVAGRCFVHARRRDPSRFLPQGMWSDDWRDQAAFRTDILLTALYLGASALAFFGQIAPHIEEAALLVFLIFGNLTTCSAFFPLIRNVLENPDDERTAPWTIWAAGYALLALTTIAVDGGAATELLIYPALNAFLHGAVAFLSRKSRREYHATRWTPQMRATT